MNTLSLQLHAERGAVPLEVPVSQLVIAGWTGRDQAAVGAHIRELAGIGVTPPTRTPIFYRVSASLLTLQETIQVLGRESSGEVELVLIQDSDRLLVGLGSDHTDRKAEAIGVALSKQMCPKPLAPQVWEYDAVQAHWDELMLRSYIVQGQERMLYQEGRAAAMLPPAELVLGYCGAAQLSPGAVMFCGTLSARGGVRWAEGFLLELEDPVLQRKIVHGYRIEALPVES